MQIVTTSAGDIVPDQTSRAIPIEDNEILMMDPRTLRIGDGAGRGAGPDLDQDAVNCLADAMFAKGYDHTRPVTGVWMDLAGGLQEVQIVDGARRVRAALIATSKGAKIDAVPVRIMPGNMSSPDDRARLCNAVVAD